MGDGACTALAFLAFAVVTSCPMNVGPEAISRIASWSFGMREYGKRHSAVFSWVITIALCSLVWTCLNLVRDFIGRGPAIILSVLVAVVCFVAIFVGVRWRSR